MIPKITRGHDLPGLLAYLASPGRHNEHSDPHLVTGDPAVMAWFSDDELSTSVARAIGHELDRPRAVFDVDVPRGHVWHCSLSLPAEEGQLSDESWAAIGSEFMEAMGFIGGERAPVRYVAVRHGCSERGNDHIHLAVSLVREDGTKANTWNDYRRAQAAAGELERAHGLRVLESREMGIGGRQENRADLRRVREGAPEGVRARLERVVRGTAAVSGSEAEFVAGLRGAGLLVRPRFAAGSHDVVTGFSVATRPPAGQAPLWFGGGRLARDLTLPRLREAWVDDPEAAGRAARAWRQAGRGAGPAGLPRRGVGVPESEAGRRASGEVAALAERLRQVPPGDPAWPAAAHELAGAFSAWSLAVEGARPGPLAATARTLARSASVRRPRVSRETPSLRGVSLILASAGHGGRGPVGTAVLLRQLSNTARALYDAHLAAGRAQEAARIADVMLTDLEAVRRALPPPAVEDAVGAVPRSPGSPVPSPLPGSVRAPDRGGVGR